MFSKEGIAKINETIAKKTEEAQKEKNEIEKLKKDIQTEKIRINKKEQHAIEEARKQEKIKENLKKELEKFKNVKQELESKISTIMKENQHMSNANNIHLQDQEVRLKTMRTQAFEEFNRMKSYNENNQKILEDKAKQLADVAQAIQREAIKLANEKEDFINYAVNREMELELWENKLGDEDEMQVMKSKLEDDQTNFITEKKELNKMRETQDRIAQKLQQKDWEMEQEIENFKHYLRKSKWELDELKNSPNWDEYKIRDKEAEIYELKRNIDDLKLQQAVNIEEFMASDFDLRIRDQELDDRAEKLEHKLEGYEKVKKKYGDQIQNFKDEKREFEENEIILLQELDKMQREKEILLEIIQTTPEEIQKFQMEKKQFEIQELDFLEACEELEKEREEIEKEKEELMKVTGAGNGLW